MAGPLPKGIAGDLSLNDEKGPLIYVRSTDDDCWFLNGHTAGLDIEWLVDSGAGHSLIDFQKFMQIDPTK